MLRIARALVEALVAYTRISWWGLVAPRTHARGKLVVVQAVIVGDEGVVLTVRSDLKGWELPGGTVEGSETPEQALQREVAEETGLGITLERHVGDWIRSGFRPHTAKVYRCRITGGHLRPSSETPTVACFAEDAIPESLFPWYRGPLAHGLGPPADPVRFEEHWGLEEIRAGLRIDLRMRLDKR